MFGEKPSSLPFNTEKNNHSRQKPVQFSSRSQQIVFSKANDGTEKEQLKKV